MERFSIDYDKNTAAGTVVHVAVDGVYAGYIVIADEVKDDAKAAIDGLKAAGIRKTVMLTGDNRAVAEAIGKELGVDEIHAELLPGGKVDEMERLMSEKSEKGKLVFVGDGINDAPVLARADIGVAMGGLGSDAAIEAADVVIMTDEPSKLGTLMRISKKTLRIVMQNIVFAISVKTAIQILSVTHLLDGIILWLAVLGDVGVSIIAILNACRVLRYKDEKTK
jgi:Cd2+/Zn2+-exporting ATPase